MKKRSKKQYYVKLPYQDRKQAAKGDFIFSNELNQHMIMVRSWFNDPIWISIYDANTDKFIKRVYIK